MAPHEAWIKQLGIKPLSARSIVLSSLLGSHPPEMTSAALVRLAERFDIEPGTLRTALSRMVSSGDLTVDEGRYRLSKRLVERQRQQDASQAGARTSWDGDWFTVIAEDDGRSAPDRRAFRAAAVGARLGELRPAIWMRPTNITLDFDALSQDLSAESSVIVTRGPLLTTSPAELVAKLWEVEAIEARARHLLAALDASERDLLQEGSLAIANAFATSAAIVQFLRTEPQLPNEISSAPRTGTELRTRYLELNALYRQQLAAFQAQD